jgi:hypothetical protein
VVGLGGRRSRAHPHLHRHLEGLMGWLIFSAYLLVAVVCGVRFGVRYIERDAREELGRRERWRRRFNEPHEDDGEPLVDDFERGGFVLGGMLLGLIWPLSLPFRLLMRVAVAPTEMVERDRLELERLRKLAREHDLPMPGGDR